jgi:glutamate synthase domain-containing protein 3
MEIEYAEQPLTPEEADEQHVDREWVERLIEDHIAKGNKPDHEAALRIHEELMAEFAKLPPTGRTEEEAQAFIARYCPRRSFFR